jgi:hypothetical protein
LQNAAVAEIFDLVERVDAAEPNIDAKLTLQCEIVAELEIDRE